MDVTHLDDDDIVTNTLPSDDAKNQVVERVKTGSNKICIREDLTKENVVRHGERSTH